MRVAVYLVQYTVSDRLSQYHGLASCDFVAIRVSEAVAHSRFCAM